jgi:hypothetical protein
MAGGARRALWGMALVTAAAIGGCRSCAEERGAAPDAAPAQPTMPTGMLMPVEGGGATPAVDAGAGAGPNALRIARGVKSGAWTELQLAKPGDAPGRTDFQHWRADSSFVSLEAMTLLHEPFARALPGFDLFLPRLFGPEALVKLGAELDSFAQRSTGELAGTARDLAQLARDTAAKNQSLWVLGP